MYLFFECCSILICVYKVFVWMLFCASCVCCACGGQKRTWILWNWSYRFLFLCGCWELIPGPSNKHNVKRACVSGVLRHKWGICVILSQNSGVIVEEGRRDCRARGQRELEQNQVFLPWQDQSIPDITAAVAACRRSSQSTVQLGGEEPRAPTTSFDPLESFWLLG